MATPPWLHVADQYTTSWRLGFGATYYRVLSGSQTNEPTVEANYQTVMQDAATFSKMYTNVRVNSSASGSIVQRFRVNGANGNQVITTSAGVTGEQTDASNTDTVSAGDLVGYMQTDSAGSSNWQASVSVLCASDGICTYVASEDAISCSIGTTSWSAIDGRLIPGGTEAQYSVYMSTAAVVRDLHVNCATNTNSSGNLVITFRDDFASTSMVVTFGPGVTGGLTDSTHTDTFTGGGTEDASIQIAQGGNGGSTLSNIQVTADSVAHRFMNVPVLTFQGTDQFMTVQGRYVTATEASASVNARSSFRARNLYVEVSNNTTTVANIYVRKNGANTAIVVAYGSGVTGVIEDITHTADYVDGDKINYHYDNISGTSFVIRTLSVEQTETPAAAVAYFEMGGMAYAPVPRRRSRAVAY